MFDLSNILVVLFFGGLAIYGCSLILDLFFFARNFIKDKTKPTSSELFDAALKTLALVGAYFIITNV